MDEGDLATFEQARPRLLGLAYRILGARADAEDAVQDCFLKWRAADRHAIDQPTAWLSTVCTRRCLDLLRAPHRARVDYVGPWLPEPLHLAQPFASVEAGLADTLSTAFLLILERLTPRERAAFLLREVFDQPYAQVAATLEMAPAACRKLVSRAKAHISRGEARHVTPPETQGRLLDAFQSALASGATEPFAAILSSDIRLTSDGGGKAIAALRVLQGPEVIGFLLHVARFWKACVWTRADLGGRCGAILTGAEGRPVLTVSFDYNAAGRISDIFVTRNPDKLMRLEPVVVE